MDNDDYIEYLEEKETEFIQEINELKDELEQLDDKVAIQENELNEKEQIIDDLEDKLDALDDDILDRIKYHAYEMGYSRYMGKNLVVVEDGSIGYFEYSVRDILDIQDYANTQHVACNALKDIYCNNFPAHLNDFIEKHKKEGEESAKKSIKEMKNSPDTYTRKLAGGK
jgi:hypothetical protein